MQTTERAQNSPHPNHFIVNSLVDVAVVAGVLAVVAGGAVAVLP
jgi:hypothetical protein